MKSLVRCVLSFCALTCVVMVAGAVDGGAGQSRAGANLVQTNWQEALSAARAAWRTNSAVALALCDRAVALAPADPRPWLLRAAVFDSRRDFENAARDASEALRLDPKAAEAWQLRGMLNFKRSRFRDSVADFDRFLELVPGQRPNHWQRGISLYYAGEFEEGRKQFELHQTVNPNDVENAAWHFLCTARSQGVARARASLLPVGPDARVPMAEILNLFGEKGSSAQVLAAADAARNNEDARFYAHLYLGLYYDALNDPERARDHIAKAVAIGPQHYMGDVARVHARVLAGRAADK